jgi:uncharacterized protein YuzE
MKITYDPEVDALYISFKQGPTEVTTIRISDDVAIDLGLKEEIVGIEILDASIHLNGEKLKPKILLENLEPV